MGSAPEVLDAGGGLRLEALYPRHAEAIFAVVDTDRGHLRRWLPWVDSSLAVSDTRLFLESMERHRAAGATLLYGLFLQGEFCGVIGLHDIKPADGKLQVGYWIRSSAQGKGLMTRSVAAVLKLAFGPLGMERVEICCAVGNTRSSAIPERLGFRFEGVSRHAQRLNGRHVDLRIYGLLREEYLAAQQV